MLDDLIERVEKASGQDREIDALLWCEFVRGAPFHSIADFGVRYLNEDGSGSGVMWTSVPAYTDSLDSALALKNRVLPGHACAVGDMAFEGGPHEPWACIWTKGGEPKFNEHGATPALALCLALLRAKASQ